MEENYDTDLFQASIEHTQKYVGYLNQCIDRLGHKSSKVRDTGDEIAKSVLDFVEKDNSNELFVKNLKQYSTYLSLVEDHRDTMIDRFNTKITKELNQFNDYLKYAKTDLKTLENLRDKEIAKQRKFSSIINRSSNRHTIKIAESNNEISYAEMTALNKKISNSMNKFNDEKSKTIEDILKEFTLIQLSFCTQAVNIYTNAYKCLINEDENVSINENQPTNIPNLIKDLYSNDIKLDMTKFSDFKATKKASELPLTLKKRFRSFSARKYVSTTTIMAQQQQQQQQKQPQQSPSKPNSLNSIKNRTIFQNEHINWNREKGDKLKFDEGRLLSQEVLVQSVLRGGENHQLSTDEFSSNESNERELDERKQNLGRRVMNRRGSLKISKYFFNETQL